MGRPWLWELGVEMSDSHSKTAGFEKREKQTKKESQQGVVSSCRDLVVALQEMGSLRGWWGCCPLILVSLFPASQSVVALGIHVF